MRLCVWLSDPGSRQTSRTQRLDHPNKIWSQSDQHLKSEQSISNVEVNKEHEGHCSIHSSLYLFTRISKSLIYAKGKCVRNTGQVSIWICGVLSAKIHAYKLAWFVGWWRSVIRYATHLPMLTGNQRWLCMLTARSLALYIWTRYPSRLLWSFLTK